MEDALLTEKGKQDAKATGENLRKMIKNDVGVTEEDIEKRIERILNNINGLLKRLKGDKVPFSKLVKEWDRDSIVDNLVPNSSIECWSSKP